MWVGSTFIEYELSVDELNTNDDYAIIVSTTNEEDVTFLVEKSGTYKNKVEGLKPEWEYTLSFVCLDDYLGNVVLFKETFQTKANLIVPVAPPEEPPIEPPVEPPALPDYNVDVYNVTIEGFNKVKVYFNTENLDENCTVELLVLYEDMSQQTVVLSQEDLNNRYVEVDVRGDAIMTFKPIIKLSDDGKEIELTEYTHNFTENLSADVIVNFNYGEIRFYLKALQNNATRVQIVESSTGTTVYDEEIYESLIRYYLSAVGTGVVNYTIYLTNNEGEKVSNGYEVVVNTEFTDRSTYTFNYKNPNDVGLTYNEDGTLNVYVQTDFESSNPDLYYQVTLGEYVFKSREKTLVARGVPDGVYGITYDVCIDVDGVAYSLFSVTPSGAVNEFYFEYVINSTVVDNSVTLSIYSYHKAQVNLSSVRVKTSEGEEINIAESEWLYDVDNDMYYCTVEVTGNFEYFDVFVLAHPTKHVIEQIGEYVGNIEKEYTYRVFK